MNDGEFGGFFALGFTEEIVVLQAHPVFWLSPEVAAQFQAVLGSEQAAAGEDVIEKLRADVKIRGESGLRKSVIVKKISEHRGSRIGEWDFSFHGVQW
jgi:hypothetical protein